MTNTNGHGPRRAILYARVSTDEQARSGYSLAQQIEALRDYATREGYEVFEEVRDAGQSGASLERPGMDRVRDLVAAGGVSVVLAQDRDRFSREPAYLYLLREEFSARGTTLKSLNDRGDDSPEGELTNGILDQLAKFERAKTAERSRRGKKQKARLGKILSTRAAYGSAWNATRDGYVIDPEQMAVMRRMFYMVGVENRSLCAVQEQLSEDGVSSPTGKARWDVQSIRKLLRRDLYRAHTYLRAGDSRPGRAVGTGAQRQVRRLLVRRACPHAQEGLGERRGRAVVQVSLHVQHAPGSEARWRTGSRPRHSAGVGGRRKGELRGEPPGRERG
jgi:DNA invertase Pin-like site-specific DNA recombinase